MAERIKVPVSVFVRLPVLFLAFAVEIVSALLPVTSTVSPSGPMKIARVVLNEPVACNVPPLKFSCLPLTPRLVSALTLTVAPSLTYVWPE